MSGLTLSANGGTWGNITGTLSGQTDLQTALDAKINRSGGTFTGTVTFQQSLYAADISTTSFAAVGAVSVPDGSFTIAKTTGLQTALDGKSSTSHTHTFSSLTSKPTTLAGYGITDAAASSHTHALSSLTQSGAFSKQVAMWSGGNWVPSAVSYLDLTDVPTAVPLTASKVVANAAARLALSLADAEGFAVVEADTGKSYMLVENGNPATSGDWTQIGDRDIQWADVGGKPTIPTVDNTTVNTAIAEDPDASREAMQAAKVVHHVVVGDSLSSSGSGSMEAYSWAAYWSRFSSNVGVNYTNLAVGGRTAAQIDAAHATQVTPISPATLGGSGYLFALCGTNDLGVSGSSAATVQGLLTSIWGKARTDGFKVVAFTITKGSTITAGEETNRVSVNTWIRTQSAAYDYLIDLDRIYPNILSDTRYYDDSLHFSAIGGQFIARLVKNTIDGGGDFNFSIAHAKDVGTFSVPNGAAYTIIPYTNIVEDRLSTISAGVFTAPADGYYQVDFSIACQTASASIRWIVEIYVDGSSHRRVLDITSTDYMLSGSRKVKLTRGQTLDIRANHTNGSAITINATNPASELIITKVPVYPS